MTQDNGNNVNPFQVILDEESKLRFTSFHGMAMDTPGMLVMENLDKMKANGLQGTDLFKALQGARDSLISNTSMASVTLKVEGVFWFVWKDGCKPDYNEIVVEGNF